MSRKTSALKQWTQFGIDYAMQVSDCEAYLQEVGKGLRAIGYTVEVTQDDDLPGWYSLWAERIPNEVQHAS